MDNLLKTLNSMDYIQKGTDAEEDPDSLFKFRDIVAHQGPLESTDPNHKGSKYNVLVEWESGTRCVECDLAEPESLASLGGSAPGVVDGILSTFCTQL